MSEPAEKPKLTEDQAALVYEGILTRTILLHLLATAVGVALAVAIFVTVQRMALKVVLIAAAILAAGIGMRLAVLSARCPSCGGRVLARIHSIVQVRSVKRCPECDIRLRG